MTDHAASPGETPVVAVDDDDTLLAVVAQTMEASFGIRLAHVPGDALAVETDLGTLFVGVLSELIVSLELRLPGEFAASRPLLEYLNDRNAGSALVTFSVLDERLWISGNVDGDPFAPRHLDRVLTFMFQAAVAIAADLDVQVG